MNQLLPIKVFYNGHIYTQDTAFPIATMLVVIGDRILTVSKDDSLLDQFTGSNQQKVEKINLNGRTVFPGFCDAHIHLNYYSSFLEQINCETNTQQECLNLVGVQLAHTLPNHWILGHGWNHNVWQEGYGTAQQLDKISPNLPVYLTAKSLHAGWANTQALSLAGINQNTPNPSGGVIERDELGKPTGILFESAMQLVERIIPKPSVAELAQSLLNAQATLIQMGITCVHDFDGIDCFKSLQILDHEQKLKIRVLKSIPFESITTAIGLGLRSGFGNQHLRLGSIKLFADGALGPRTAAMFQPYQGESNNLGKLFLTRDELVEKTHQAVENGLSLAVHAIGDRAIHEMLDGFEKLRQIEKGKSGHTSPLRHRIEHVQLLHPQDISRLAQLDMIASMQPIHATSDMVIADRYWGERSHLAYAWKTLQEQNTCLIFGSDAPVESPNPFWGLHAAITRQIIEGNPQPGWIPEQKISLNEAIRAYTTNPAYAAGMENMCGKLTAGFLADLIILDQNPNEITPDQIYDLKPSGTILDGEWVWRDFD